MRVALGSMIVLILALIGVVWGASFFGVLAQDREFQLASNRMIVDPLDARVRELLGPDAERTHLQKCLPRSRGAHNCVFIGMATDLPRCPLFEAAENCRAIELSASLLEIPDIRALVERQTSDFCTYGRDPIPPENFRVDKRVVGCAPPWSAVSIGLSRAAYDLRSCS
jgi:hypothetical protein